MRYFWLRNLPVDAVSGRQDVIRCNQRSAAEEIAVQSQRHLLDIILFPVIFSD